MNGYPKIPRVFVSKNWQSCLEHWCLYIFQQGSESRKTVKEYSRTIKQFFGGLKPLEDGKKNRTPETVKHQEVLDFINQPTSSAGKPPSPYTYNSRLAILSSFYKYAARFDPTGTGRKLFNATPPTHGLTKRSTKPADRTLTPDEVKKFIAVIPRDTIRGQRDRALVLFYLLTGRRCSEVLSLRWCDLEYRGGQWYYHFRGKGHRDIDDKDVLHPLAKAALDEYLEFSKRKDTIQPEDALFTAVKWRREALPMNPHSIGAIFKPYWDAAGLKGSCHFFRHTHAYEFFLSTNKDIMKVSRRLRHRSLDQTRAYLEAAEQSDVSDMDGMLVRFGVL